MTDKNSKKTITQKIGTIIRSDIVPEMEQSYLNYAMSVIVSRALPDVRDGLKPVHRRIIYAMSQMGLGHSSKNTKSAKVVGEVLGKFHPHGDSSVYMAMVRMAQDFSLRYPLIKGQGNFGSIDGDPPAAMRYTEVKMAKIAQEMVDEINKDTVETMDNFDGTLQEPTVLPSRIPNLILNGADGIAVGMATKIPPHNLVEICQAIDHILDHCHLETSPDTAIPNLILTTTRDKVLEDIYMLENTKYILETSAATQDLIQFVKGPDFPTKGEIHGEKGIVDMYTTGRGKFNIRGKAKIEETKTGKFRIIITEIPYQVNKSDLVVKIADLAKDKKIQNISDLRDESDRKGIRIVVELKKGAKPKSVLNKIFKFTPLQTSYSANIIALVEGRPQTLNLRQILLYFLRHRENIIRRKTFFDLKETKIRSHILEGLKIAIDIIDEVIAVIKASKSTDDARQNLMVKFKLTDLQANAILEMQLRRLAALEIEKINEEYKQLSDLIKKLTSIVTDETKMIAVLKQDNAEIVEKYQDNRKTTIYKRDLEEFSEEDLIPNLPSIITITKTGYIKRVPKDSYKQQNRGGKGISGISTKKEDEVSALIYANTHDNLLFFTNLGKVYRTKVWEIQESNRHSKGQNIVNLININSHETIQATLSLDKLQSGGKYILLATKKGVVKKTSLQKLSNIRQSGLAAINLDKDDQLCWAIHTSGEDHIFLVTKQGKCIRFHESDIRPMGRHSRGVRGISLKNDDYVVGVAALVAKPEKDYFQDLVVITENGIGKRTDVFLYPLQHRGGVGVKVANLSNKTGLIADAQVVNNSHKQVILISNKGITLKIPLKNIPSLKRNTKGVILMRFKTNDDQLSAMAIMKEEAVGEGIAVK